MPTREQLLTGARLPDILPAPAVRVFSFTPSALDWPVTSDVWITVSGWKRPRSIDDCFWDGLAKKHQQQLGLRSDRGVRVIHPA